MDETFVMLGKGVDTFKRDMAVTPLRPMHGVKHTGEPRFVCSSKILEPKFSLPNIDAFFKY